jgi:hypothetical protein
MKASALYRIAAVLILLFDIGHTFGFRQSDPSWGVEALVGSMRSIHFDVSRRETCQSYSPQGLFRLRKCGGFPLR